MKIAPWERVGKLYISFVNEQYEYMHETNGRVEVYTIVYMKIAPWEREGKLYIFFVNEQYEYMSTLPLVSCMYSYCSFTKDIYNFPTLSHGAIFMYTIVYTSTLPLVSCMYSYCS
jgi:hypothetical protein